MIRISSSVGLTALVAAVSLASACAAHNEGTCPAVAPALPAVSPAPSTAASPVSAASVPVAPSATASVAAPPGVSGCPLRDVLKEGAPRSPDEPWTVATPESEGISSAALDSAIAGLTQEGRLVSSLLVIKNDKLVVERYGCLRNLDPRPVLETRAMTPNQRVVTYSFTKSVAGLLVGIAIQDRLLSLDSKVLDVLKITPAHPSPAKSALKLEQLLTHRCGLAWGGTDDANLALFPDAAQEILDRPLASDPGTKWFYHTGCSHLIGAMLQKVTGSTARYAEARLFRPLGIRGATWLSDAQGIPMTGSGLMITPRDMAKIGVLMLNKGRWESMEIVPAAWVEQSLSSHTTTEWGHDYGYHWWILGGPHDPNSPRGFGARGAFGQNMYVLSDSNTVVVYTAGLPLQQADRTLEGFLFKELAPILAGKAPTK